MKWVFFILLINSQVTGSTEARLTPPERWLSIQVFNVSIAQHLAKFHQINPPSADPHRQKLIEEWGLDAISQWAYHVSTSLYQQVPFSIEAIDSISSKARPLDNPYKVPESWLTKRGTNSAYFKSLIFSRWEEVRDLCPPAPSISQKTKSICDPGLSSSYFQSIGNTSNDLKGLLEKLTQHKFPAALQLAYQLQKQTQEFRPLYTVIQSTFSQYQQGNGKVAIQP